MNDTIFVSQNKKALVNGRNIYCLYVSQYVDLKKNETTWSIKANCVGTNGAIVLGSYTSELECMQNFLSMQTDLECNNRWVNVK